MKPKKINNVTDIAEFAGKVVYVTFEHNRRKSGIARVWERPQHFSNQSYGYGCTQAVMEGVHGNIGITDRDIEKGDVFIRLATNEEVENAIPSYDEKWTAG